ncbi:MAG TPA: DNA ligase [Humisphaera sp.]|jgi:DNA ligase-1|nr:DNA ligase [Humisphaera sp.]
MTDLADGETTEMKGSGAKPYVLKNTGGVYSCSCPAWRNQSITIERRTCKHLRKLRGDAAEEARIGGALPQKPVKQTADREEEGAGPPLLLAESWDNAADLSGWWMSEKLDGVRAYWDGGQFLSRQGNFFHAPDWFVQGLPKIPLDGELWIDRKKFQRTVSIVRRQDKNDLWNEVKYLVFDAPGVVGAFEERFKAVKETLDGKAKFAKPHDHDICKDVDCLRAELARIESLGGEGLMLRQPGSKYEVGRSSTLLKVKSFRDAEAIVIGHQAGAGKHKGRLGALLVRLSDGTEFAVGTGFSDREREAPPAVGATITFRYQELSDGGVPRFPSYLRLRTNLEPESALSPPPVLRGRVRVGVRASDAPSTQPPPQPSPGVPGAGETTPASSGEGTKPRYFEFVDDKSNKFWEISQSGCDVTTRWGRIGSNGQSKTKSFAQASAAEAQASKLIEEKTAEGYEEK